MASDIQIVILPTGADLTPAFAIRREVFIDEQGVSESEEFDALDALAVHFLVWQDKQAIATARLRFLEGWAKLERIAVQKVWRGQGIGEALVLFILKMAAAQGYQQFKLHAQTRALGFYQRLGFEAVGEIFLDAGIEHQEMQLKSA